MAEIDVASKLKDLSDQEDAETPFGEYEEGAIVSLAFDHPEFFMSAVRFLKPDMFKTPAAKIAMAEILNRFEKYSMVPTRNLLRDEVKRSLEKSTHDDDPYVVELFDLIDRKSNPRDVPLIKDTLLAWSRSKAYGLLYTDEAQSAYLRKDYEHLEKIINEANKIVDVGNTGFWFFEDMELLFQKDVIDHKTTGFPQLDKILNCGGPSAKEVVCWLAGTNVGKSIMLCNNAIASLQGESTGGEMGQDVLLVTFELDTIKTAMRCVASMFGIQLDHVADRQDYIRRVSKQFQNTYKKRFLIHELPPDECSVSHIYALMASLKRTVGWKPDVVILDYMDLMVSRNPSYNKDDYTRQKHVANEIRGLAKNENVLIFTATQTNRGGAKGEEVVDMGSAAESFAKQFSMDYVVSLNQSKTDRQLKPPRIRLFVAKNRNGPKHETINCSINYDIMQVKELL